MNNLMRNLMIAGAVTVGLYSAASLGAIACDYHNGRGYFSASNGNRNGGLRPCDQYDLYGQTNGRCDDRRTWVEYLHPASLWNAYTGG